METQEDGSRDQGDGRNPLAPFPAPFVILPFLPPTANQIYVTNWKRKIRFLSKEADAFKKKTIAQIASNCQAQIARFNPTGVFTTWYAFYFDPDEILTKTFGQGKKDSAVSRYKKMDVENRVKLVSDALATAIGIDDSQFFESGHTKMPCSFIGSSPQLHIFLTEVEPRRFGL